MNPVDVNTPKPIMLATTMAVAAVMPIRRVAAGAPGPPEAVTDDAPEAVTDDAPEG
jgi:hypothetical protein